MADYNTMELMICVAARELEDGASVGVGTGAPCAAAMLAQRSPEAIAACADQSVRVCGSGVDSWGLREWYPLQREKIDWPTLARRVLKVVWLCTHGCGPQRLVARQQAGVLRSELQRYYRLDDAALVDRCRHVALDLQDLHAIAAAGASQAESLRCCASAHPLDPTVLQQHDRHLQQIDARLMARAEAVTGMEPLVQLHLFCREEVGGAGLDQLAANTCRVYEELCQRISVTREIIDGLQQQNVSLQRSVA